MGLGQAMGGAGGSMQQQGIAALLAAAAAKNPQSQMTGIGAGMQQLQPVRQDLSSMFTPEQLQKLRQVTDVPVQQAQQVPMGMPFQAGATFDPSLSYNPMQTATPAGPMTEQHWLQHAATALYAPGTDMEKEKARFLSQPVPGMPMQQAPQLGGALGGVMGLGQAMGNNYGGALPGINSTNTTTTQDMMGGNRGAPQTNMASNLAQMFNQLGGQQPAQQGGTPLQNGASPLQNGASPLQQSAQPVMNPGVM
jgi:hypothetical protein